jgi:hypothetical protein
VSKFRAKLFIAFWFSLISLGQAYPFAVVYAHVRTEQCGCNLKGHKCVHGCALKKRIKAEGLHGVMGHKANDETSSQDQWISPNCSRQKVREVLSFQSEPFLLSPTQNLQGPPVMDFFHQPQVTPASLLLSCDDPPPKEDVPPEDPASLI